jgi:hypothetical protein
MAIGIDKRGFIAGLGAAALAWPFAVQAQQPAMPMVAVIGGGSANTAARLVTAFRKGLNEPGYVEGQNVTVEYHWLEGHYDRLPALMIDLVHRQVAVIATPASNVASLAAKAQLRRSRSCLVSAKTRFGSVLSPVSPGPGATRPGSMFSAKR